jgi:hypothetical protein
MTIMANQIPEGALSAIEKIVASHFGAMRASEISEALPAPIPQRTLQYHLKRLVSDNRLIREGNGRWAKYRLREADPGSRSAAEDEVFSIALSDAAKSVRAYVRQPPEARRPVGYNRDFLNLYHPNVTYYLTDAERARLASVGRPQIVEQPAGTYAKHILGRLLIDLAWNSSRLEGNTYSHLDTKRLIEFGELAKGRAHIEAQMILNHKDAIEFLVSAADEIGFNRHTILNLHGLLANNLQRSLRRSTKVTSPGIRFVLQSSPLGAECGRQRNRFHAADAAILSRSGSNSGWDARSQYLLAH